MPMLSEFHAVDQPMPHVSPMGVLRFIVSSNLIQLPLQTSGNILLFTGVSNDLLFVLVGLSIFIPLLPS